MPQMCPNCSRDNLDGAFDCVYCSGILRGLLGSNSLLASRYRVTRVLGCGGMGAVYLAEDTRIVGRQVAVKENLDPVAQAQFQAEISMMAVLSHPGLPAISDQFLGANGRQYLVMDFIAGDNLEELVNRGGPLPEAEVTKLGRGLLDILEYLHVNGIIHRDVKPANIKLTPAGKPVLVDFGIAKQWAQGVKTQSWARGLGSPGFAPPEQYGGGTDQRSDLYSLGAVLYFLVTAQVPPESTKLAAGAPLTPPRQIRPDLSQGMQRVIFRAMAPVQSQRFQSAGEMRRELAAAPAPTVVVSQPPTVTLKRGAATPSRWLFWAGGAVVLLVVLVGLNAASRGGRPAASPTPVPVARVVESVTPTSVASGASTTPTRTVTRATETYSSTPRPPTATPTDTASPTPTPTPTRRTPTPTATLPPPSATPTPRPVAQASGGLNVRSGPGGHYPQIASAQNGQRFLITGRNGDCAWLQVTIPGGSTGWVPAGSVSANVLPCAPAEVATPPVPSPTPRPTPKPTPVRPTSPPPTLANNTTQFSEGQGRYGWWYQVEKGRNSGVFEDFQIFGWYGTPTRNCWQTNQEAHVRICEYGEVHPGATGRIAYRWRSDTGRSVRFEVHAHKLDTGCGDGVWIGVFRVPQGQPPGKVGEFTLGGRDGQGQTTNYNLTLNAGDSVLVMVDIRGGSTCDATQLRINVY